MEPSTMPPPLSHQLSYSTVSCNSRSIGGDGLDATPGPVTEPVLAQSRGSQTSHITLPSPPQGNTQLSFPPPNTGLTSQTLLLPEEIDSADLSSGAQPSFTSLAVREVSVNDVTLSRHTKHQPAAGEAALASAEPMPLQAASLRVVVSFSMDEEETTILAADNDDPLPATSGPPALTPTCLSDLPNEVLLQILRYLDVCDLLCTSRTSHRLRALSLAPILHAYRLQRTRSILPPMLWSPFRPSLADLIRRSIFLTRTTVVSRKLARSLVCIRLSRRLAARPSVEALVARSVLPPECLLPSNSKRAAVAPALVAKKRAVERERVKDGLRRWVERVWRGEVRERGEGVKLWEEKVGVGRVWRLRRFWESVGRNGRGVENG